MPLFDDKDDDDDVETVDLPSPPVALVVVVVVEALAVCEVGLATFVVIESSCFWKKS